MEIHIPPHHIHEWGYSPLPFSAPLSWGQSLQTSWNSINQCSYFVNKGILEMLSLWQNYKHFRLFFIPNTLKQDQQQNKITKPMLETEQNENNENAENEQKEKENKPKISDINQHKKHNYIMSMSIQQFRDQQEEHLTIVRNIFINNWYNDCVLIMKRYVEENGLDSSETSTMNLFSAINAFMSRQLCQIVYQSLNECVEFFEQYLNAPTAVSSIYNRKIDDVLDIKPVPFSTDPHLQPLWKIGMELSRDGIDFDIPLEEINVTINDILENIVNCFDGIVSCVEGKIFGLLENVGNLSVFIDDDIKKTSRSRIGIITRKFINELEYLLDRYTMQYAPLFEANDELTQRLVEIENEDINTNNYVDGHNHNKHSSLDAFKDEIKKYEMIADDVRNKANIRLRMGIFEVECQSVNSLIINHAHDLKNGITNHIAKRLTDSAQRLVSIYESGSKQLIKKPENAQDLVDLVNYIKLFEESELTQCQNISNDIYIKLKFLFETNHSLSHDILRSVGRVSDWNKKILLHKNIADENYKIQKESIEKSIIAQTKQFEHKLKKMYQEVEDIQLLSEIRDTSKIDQLRQNMKKIDDERDFLLSQQKLLQIKQSDFKIYNSLKLSLVVLD